MSVDAYMLVETSVEPGEFVRLAREVEGVRAVWKVHEVPGLKSADTRIARSI